MHVRTSQRGVVLRGLVLPGQDRRGADPAAHEDGVVILDGGGTVAAIGPAPQVDTPPDLPVLGGPGKWIAHGVVDAHVHLAFADDPGDVLAGGCVAVRDLGAPAELSRQLRTTGDRWPVVAVAGPLLTAPGGYPSRTWGRAGFADFVGDPAAAARTVTRLAPEVDVVKLALEPAGGQPVPDIATARAVVAAAHDAGLAVTCHALRTAMVERALDAGVDELCHVPTEPLPTPTIERLVAAGVPVVSTLHAHAAHDADAVLVNARALVAAAVEIRYGTDLGNAGTSPGVDPVELRLLAGAGLGGAGAWWAATTGAARAPGLPDALTGTLERGGRPLLVVLDGDPRAEPGLARRPSAVVGHARIATMTSKVPAASDGGSA